MVFWLMVIILLLIAAGLLVVPALRRESSENEISRDTFNKALYYQRLNELKQDQAQGVAAQSEESITELQRTMLLDMVEQQPVAKSISRWVLLPGVLLFFFIVSALYLKSGGLMQLRTWQQVMAQLPQLKARVAHADAEPLNEEELARLKLAIRTQLQQQPYNIEDWVLLGQIGIAQNNATTAIQAFERAYHLAPENQEVQIQYVDVLTRSSNPEDNQRATLILQQLSKVQDDDVRILSLLAFNAFERGDYARAISAWQRMLLLLPPGDKRIDVLKRSIALAKTRVSQNAFKLLIDISLSSTAAAATNQRGILVVSVNDGTNGELVAEKRLPYGQFPQRVLLDDSDVINPTRLLSSLQQIKVQVRLAEDEHMLPYAKQWYGESALVELPATKQVDVNITQLLKN